jgi:glycosyltransferase involved in cell wall biosynthesis
MDVSRSTSTSARGGRTLLSVVLPAYNEQEVLPLAHERLSAMEPILAEREVDYELVFVNDGSRDRTAQMLDELALSDPHVRAVHLTRNFGHQAAVTAGLEMARGDVVAIMDCDLQDPPEVLPEFLSKWRQGFQVVYAIRKKAQGMAGQASGLLDVLPADAVGERVGHPAGQRGFLPDGPLGGRSAQWAARAAAVCPGAADMDRPEADRRGV